MAQSDIYIVRRGEVKDSFAQIVKNKNLQFHHVKVLNKRFHMDQPFYQDIADKQKSNQKQTISLEIP